MESYTKYLDISQAILKDDAYSELKKSTGDNEKPSIVYNRHLTVVLFSL